MPRTVKSLTMSFLLYFLLHLKRPTSSRITEPLNALYIASGRNDERCRRQLNAVNNVALPSADIPLSRQRSGRQRESKWRTQSEANPRYYSDLAVRNNVNHTLSSEWGVSLETPDVNALPLPMTATSLIKDSEIAPTILQLLPLRLSADISLMVSLLSRHPALAGRPTTYPESSFRERWTLISHTRSLKRALQIRWQLVAASGNDREGAT